MHYWCIIVVCFFALLDVGQAVFLVVSVRDEELVVLGAVRHEGLFEKQNRTRCMVRRDVSASLSDMKRKGLGAACTAVLVKLRFPRINCKT
jgi:hypothetical protein